MKKIWVSAFFWLEGVIKPAMPNTAKLREGLCFSTCTEASTGKRKVAQKVCPEKPLVPSVGYNKIEVLNGLPTVRLN